MNAVEEAPPEDEDAVAARRARIRERLRAAASGDSKAAEGSAGAGAGASAGAGVGAGVGADAGGSAGGRGLGALPEGVALPTAPLTMSGLRELRGQLAGKPDGRPGRLDDDSDSDEDSDGPRLQAGARAKPGACACTLPACLPACVWGVSASGACACGLARACGRPSQGGVGTGYGCLGRQR